MTREDFMENTLDVWEIPAESATRVGHPAPFPIELPARLIELYTYRGDLVLDPFAGSGTAAVAAVRSGRHYVGYDLDDSYIRLAEGRVNEERQRLADETRSARVQVSLPAVPAPTGHDEDFQTRAVREGRAAKEIAGSLIEAAGFADIQKDQRQPGGVEVNFTARDRSGKVWFFDVTGSFTSHRAGLKRTDTLWKALGKAAVLREVTNTPLVLLTTDAPTRGSAGAEALKQVTGSKKPIHTVIEMLKQSGIEQLQALCDGKET
jgi:site-specific DNA-methyltransferase (adenine-specific)